METIVIKVRGGLVSDVYATSKDVEVIVIDEDCDEQPDVELPEHQVY